MKKDIVAKRQVVAVASLENYLRNLLAIEKSSYGIIIGQPSKTGPDSVVHFVKTPIDLNDDPSSENQSSIKSQNISLGIDQIIDHALNTHRSLPGSFFIIGMFVVDQKFDWDDKSVIADYHNALRELTRKLNTDLHFGDCSELDENHKLLLAYTSPGKYNCCSININQKTNFDVTPVEWIFNNNTEWYQVETFFSLKDFHPLLFNFDGEINFEKSCDDAIRNISNLVTEGIFTLVDNAPIETERSMQVYINAKQSKKKGSSSSQILKGLWYKKKSDDENIKIIRYPPGTIRFTGSICCKVWLNSNQLSSNIRYFTITDLLRSLAGRLHFYLDATTATERSLTKNMYNLDTSISLPRRIFYELTDCPELWFCDYLFPNEGMDVVVETVKSTMDFELDPSKIYFDCEVSEENDTSKLNDQCDDILNINSSEKLAKPPNYLVITIVAILFLLVGVLIKIIYTN